MSNAKDAKSREPELLAKLYETVLVESPKIMCVKRHVSSEYGQDPLMDKIKKACEYGRERNATTCGDCPYGVKLLEPRPVYDTHEVLKQLKEEQRRKATYID